MNEHGWDNVQLDIPQKKDAPPVPAAIAPPVEVKYLKEGDTRVGLRYSKTCITCLFYWYQANTQHGWCHCPQLAPNISTQQSKLTRVKLDLILEQRGWFRTHPMLVCDKWEQNKLRKLGRALDWVNYPSLPMPKEQ